MVRLLFFDILLCKFNFHMHRNGRMAAEPLGEPTSLKGEPPGPGFGVRSDL